jgi:hypothetical protein
MKVSVIVRCNSYRIGALAVLAFATLASCGADSTGNMAGAAASSGGASGGAAGQAAPGASFSAVYAMMFPMETNARCNACHANPANDVGNGKLSMGMDKATAYAAIVGKASASSHCMNQMLVVPGKPEASLFYLKLTATPPCGVRMPNGGNAFTEAQLEMVRSWISAGAHDD